MNINDNKLNELMAKTHNMVDKKKRRRRMIAAGSVGAFTIALAVVMLNIFLGMQRVPDRTVQNSGGPQAAAQNTETETPMPTPTPLPWDGSTYNPDVSVTPMAAGEIPQDVWNVWTHNENRDGANITVTIDLDVIGMPYTQALSVVEIKPAGFDLAFADKAADYFLGDEFYEYIFTKDDYQKKISALGTATTQFDPNSPKAENILKQYEFKMELAPEENTIGKVELDENGSLLLKAYPDENSIAEFQISNDGILSSSDNIYDSAFYYLRGDLDKAYADYETPPHDPERNPRGIEDVEARLLARETIKYFDDDMVSAAQFYGNAYDPNAAIVDPAYGIPDGNAEQSYTFYYTKSYGAGANALMGRTVYVPDSEGHQPAADPWGPEYIKIVVDNDGIVEFRWFNRSEKVRTVQDSVDIITIGNAVELFKDMVFTEKYWELTKQETNINITDIELKMVKTANDDGTYYMVPAYVFSGTQKSVLPSGAELNYGELEPAVILIINALDGSIIP